MSQKDSMREAVIRYCTKIGADPLLVQGSGGNISWKTDKLLWIKASGTRIAEASNDDIFVSVNLEHIHSAIQDNNFSIKPMVVGSTELRPSIETFLHALMPHKVVVHLHAIEILAYLVRKDFEEFFAQNIDPDILWVTVPYCKPGAELAKHLFKALQEKPSAEVVFLKNHGVVIGGESISKVEQTLSRILSSIKKKQPKPLSKKPSGYECIQGYNPIEDTEIHQLACDMNMFNQLPGVWALYPDHVVFLGASPNCYQSKAALLNDNTCPELAFVAGVGVYVRKEFSLAKKEQLRCYYDVLTRQNKANPLSMLTDHQVAELMNWDAEKYRMKIAR